MNNTPLQLTIREVTQHITTRLLAGLLVVICLLTITAPFNTSDQFSTIPLFFYWAVVATSTYFLAIFVIAYTKKKLASLGLSKLATLVISNLIAGTAIGLWVGFINVAIIGAYPFDTTLLMILVVQCILITFAITSIFHIAEGSKDEIITETTSQVDEKPNSHFFKRLPDSLGTDVICLRAQDHYVEVTTTLGKELVLIRLSDAISELGEDIGIQTHRSWWVVKQHVIEQKRINSKQHLLLSNGIEVPVSRTYSGEVKALLSENQ